MHDSQQQELQKIVKAILTNDDDDCVRKMHLFIDESTDFAYKRMFIDAIGVLKKSGFTDNQLKNIILHIAANRSNCTWIIGYFEDACEEVGKELETNDGATH